jgi:drug/metabolite transporter (DMT)-like permease
MRPALSSVMKNNSSATLSIATPLPSVDGGRAPSGLGWGLLGITAFSFTVPFTRLATEDGLSPLFIGAGRAVVATVLAAVVLVVTRQAWPTRVQWWRLTVVAGGVVVGFPLLTSYALASAPASHGAVVIGLLPAATAAMAVLRGREQVSAAFWVFAALGAVAVIAFAGLQNGGLGELHRADLLLLGAVVAAAIGYAEGGLLARELGSWQTVSWALVLSAPVMVVLVGVAVRDETPSASPGQWLAFAYLCVVSMYLGFFAWYRGLAIGPMAQVSQVQLVQPVMSIAWAAVILGEHVDGPTIAGGLAVIACAWCAVRARLGRR